jgi:hypothetical protein
MSTLEKVIEEVKELKPEELQQVREMVDSLLSGPTMRPQMTEDEFERYLAAKGVISIPEPASREMAEDEFAAYKPVTVEGRPLSEMIIEERR